MTIFWYLLFWLALAATAFLNGALREIGYRRFVGEMPAQQLSTLTCCALLWVCVFFFARKIPLVSRVDAIAISIAWLVLTFVFEAFLIVVPARIVPPAELPDAQFPMVLSTGRVLEHWHTGAMTRRASALDEIEPEATAMMSPMDIEARGFRPGQMIRVATRPRNSCGKG